jgi:elongation factor P
MAETINTNDLRRGTVLELPDGLFEVVEFQHHKPGKGNAVVRTKIRNVRSGAVIDKTFNSDSKVAAARLDKRDMQFLYRDGQAFVFMDTETYDQTSLDPGQVGSDMSKYLVDGVTVNIAMHEGTPVSVELPTTVDLLITKTDPGLRGDRQSAGTKPATVETGAVVQVPLFVGEGERVRIDTRTGEYVTRVTS